MQEECYCITNDWLLAFLERITMKTQKIFSIFLLLLTTACTNMRDLKVSEFRTKEYYDETVTFHKSLEELSAILVYHKLNCRDVDQLLINPDDKTSGTISWQVPGFADRATMAVMDFKEEPSKKVTNVKIYTANVFWKRRPGKILNILKAGKVCD